MPYSRDNYILKACPVPYLFNNIFNWSFTSTFPAKTIKEPIWKMSMLKQKKNIRNKLSFVSKIKTKKLSTRVILETTLLRSAFNSGLFRTEIQTLFFHFKPTLLVLLTGDVWTELCYWFRKVSKVNKARIN